MLRKTFIFLLLSITVKVFGQSPAISYTGNQTFAVGNAISPLIPVNTGGVVPATVYGQVSTFAGSGLASYLNGTGVKASFNNPVAGAFDSAGYLYIADYGNISIRKISPTGVVTTLLGNPGASGYLDGPLSTAAIKTPYGIAIDGNDNIFIADANNFRIRKITSAGTVSTFAGNATKATVDGTGITASFTNPTSVAVDAAGNVYVVDGNAIRKITSAGVVTTLAGSISSGSADGTGASASFNTPGSIATDASGNVYVDDAGNQLIRKITSAGVVSTIAGLGITATVDGSTTVTKFDLMKGIVVDKFGYIYISDRAIRVMPPTGNSVNTLIGNGISGVINGPAPGVEFNLPAGVIPDNKGNLFIVDQKNNLIRKAILTGYSISPALPGGLLFDSTTGTISGTPLVASPTTTYTVTAYNSSGRASTTLNIATIIPSVAPTATAIWPLSLNVGQTLYISGSNLAAVTAVTINGIPASSVNILSPTSITAVVAPGTTSGNVVVTSAYGTATIAGFKLLSAPNISYTSPKIYKTGATITTLSPTNRGGDIPAESYHQVSTFAGSGIIGFADGTYNKAKFNNPTTLAFDGTGSLYVADTYNNRIRKVTRAGVVSTFAGTGLQTFADGVNANAGFYNPGGIIADVTGNLYIGDTQNLRIREIGSSGSLVSTLAGGNIYASTFDGTGDQASFVKPGSVTIDAAGNIYAIDNNSIRKITAAGIATTLAGNSNGSFADGTGAAASFNQPSSIACDANGNIYVADYGNNRVRKITPQGVVTTVAGTGISGSANGSAATATFSSLEGIAIDVAGNIYVSDLHSIRTISNGTVSTYAGSATGGYKDGDISIATFGNPAGLAFDKFGSLYIADASLSVIRKIPVTGYTISPALPAGLNFDPNTGFITGTPTSVSPLTDYTITAFNNAGNSSTTLTIQVQVGPTITSFSPTAAAMGTTVSITGTNFTSITGVTFGGVPAKSFTVNSTTNITAIVDLGASGAVSLLTAAGTTSVNGFVYLPSVPTITSYTPTSAGKQSVVVLTGTDFTGATSVTFGGIAASSFTVNSISNISAVVGTGASGNINVTTPYGTGTITGFSFVPLPTITSFSPLSGTTGTQITILGSDFTTATAVSFGGVPASSFTINSDNSITATVGRGASGNISITTTGGISSFAGFTYFVLPVISSFSPTAAATSGQVIINGTGFTGATSVTFGGTAAQSFTVNSSTQITAVVGNGSTGSIVVTTATGTSTRAGFTYLLVPTITANGPTTFLTGGSVTLSASTGSGYTYQWVKDGTSIPGATTSSYLATQSGSYTVSITSKGATITSAVTQVTVVFELPASNFALTTTSATCNGSANGSIAITAVQNLNYTATITGNSVNNSYPFTTNTTINNLAAGTYDVCFTVNGQSGYQQCFTIVISQPKDLSVYTALNKTIKSLTLTLDGGDIYYITLNGNTTTTNSSIITLPVNKGVNELRVTTNRACQGIIQRQISVSDELIAYPNPFTSTLNVNLGDDNLPAVTLEVYSFTGEKVYNQQLTNQSGIVQLDLSSLHSGLYILKVSSAGSEKLYRIAKQ